MLNQPEKGIKKSGYLEIKQSSKVKNRKLKSWKRRWIVVHQMSDLTSGTYAAKVEVYTDAETASRTPGDRQTYILDHVTDVQLATSKTRPYAFEIVETEPVLVFSGSSNDETLEWMNAFKKIFYPEKPGGEYGKYEISIQPNTHSARLNLDGKYTLSVTTSDVSIQTSDGGDVIKWGLGSLKRFHLDTEPNANQRKVLVIQSGPNSYTGEGTFRFLSSRAETILSAIRMCIKEAIGLKQKQRELMPPDPNRDRAVSFTASEKNFSVLLDSSKGDRSGSILSSSSKGSTMSSPACSPSASVSASPPDLPARRVGDPKGIPKNASVPNIVGHGEDTGYSHIQGKLRTMSLTSRTSVSSRDSGVVFPEADGKGPAERVRKVSVEKRCFSNSFDSAVSNGSFEEAKRKISDVEQSIEEESHPIPIYNDIDEKLVINDSKNKSTDGKQRRHSTGTCKKENEYEDLDKFRNKDKESEGAPEKKIEDIPPALPERPRVILLRQSSKEESPLQRTGSGSKAFRHSCMAKLPNFDQGRRSSSADVANQAGGNNDLSRSSSKDLYASIPDLGSRDSMVSDAIPIHDGQTQASPLGDVNEVCLNIFAPSVGDWRISTGTSPLKVISRSLPPTPPETKPSTQPPVEDLLGLDSPLTNTDQLHVPLIDITETEDMTVTKPADLLKDFDPFDSNSMSNDLLIQGDWPCAVTDTSADTGQENPYFDMSGNNKDETESETELIYMAPSKE
ncbi:uncharacterized protein LOC124259346 [Haliotis rubra]|uniref:uncharacterized protein LOC124259346 n=1 Tax=Haliotis rubra TaxID=36100 RepID=UPI001EE5CB3E|nr:uncharacterized protein LOC124259346 [Haliotis rubra]